MAGLLASVNLSSVKPHDCNRPLGAPRLGLRSAPDFVVPNGMAGRPNIGLVPPGQYRPMCTSACSSVDCVGSKCKACASGGRCATQYSDEGGNVSAARVTVQTSTCCSLICLGYEPSRQPHVPVVIAHTAWQEHVPDWLERGALYQPAGWLLPGDVAP
jgi:hypothetical protein